MRFDYSSMEPTARFNAGRSILLATLLVVILAAFVASESSALRSAPPSTSQLTSEPENEATDVGDTHFEDVATATPELPSPPANEWVVVRVKSGQTLSTVFDGEGLPPEEWLSVLRLGGDTLKLKQLRAGDTLKLRKDGDRLAELTYVLDERRTLNIRRAGDTLESVTLEATLEHRPTYAAASIENSLFLTGQNAGLSNGMIMQLADIFGYDIDFALDIRRGDRFTVIYEELFKDGQKLRDGNILAAEFVNQGDTYRAVRYTSPDGTSAYYTPQGQSLRKAFLRTPLDFARISSGFSLARRHPILNKIRAHKGVDYAAGTGTPIKASGDGRITFQGIKGGYGKVVVVRHGGSVETLYAHMSKYRAGLGIGSRVRQGQVIGYVGRTGLATAPHLHYEFLIGGVHKNPVKVVLPRANPMPKALLTQFKTTASPYLAQLDSLGRSQFAQTTSPAAP